MRTNRKTVQVIGALILAAYAVFAAGCSQSTVPVPTPELPGAVHTLGG